MKKMLMTALTQMGLAAILVFVIGGYLAIDDPSARYSTVLPILVLLTLVGDGIRFYFSQELELPDVDQKQPIQTPEENRLDHIQYSLINLAGAMGFVFWVSEFILQFFGDLSTMWYMALVALTISGLLFLLVHPATAILLTTTQRIQQGAVAVVYRGGKRLNVTVSEGVVVISRLNLFLAWTPGRGIKTTNDVQQFEIQATTSDGIPFEATVATVVDRSPDFLPWMIAQGGTADDEINDVTGGLAELRQLERNALVHFLIPYFGNARATLTSTDGNEISLAPGVINGGTLSYAMLKDSAEPSPQATLTESAILIYNGASALSLPITLVTVGGKTVEKYKGLLNEIFQKTLEVAKENKDFEQLKSYDTEDFRKRYGALSSWFAANIMGYDSGPMPATLGLASELRDGLTDIAKLLIPLLVKGGEDEPDLRDRVRALENQLATSSEALPPHQEEE